MASGTSPSGWAGWVGFAGIILIIQGIITGIQGLMAIVGPDKYYAVTEENIFMFNVNGWGWWSIIIGILLLLVGIALMAGQTWARVIAIILVVLSAIGQVFVLGEAPFWSLLIIAVDVLILFALTVKWNEIQES
jgi:hypothetical protein